MRMFRLSGAWIFPAILWMAVVTPLGGPRALSMTKVDLELVLAVDTSGSVDSNEYRLQIDLGHGHCFTTPKRKR